jgi:glycosyltransferase involved in cell wall biosynthesis
MVSLTLVVPVLNEEILLESFMVKTESDLEAAGIDWELFMVNDGSTDASLSMMRRFAQDRPRVKVLDLPENCGPGANLYQAYAMASKDVVAYATVDGFYDTAELPSLLVHFEDHDAVSAYRTDLTSHPGFRKVQTMINVYLQRAMCPYEFKAVHTLQIHRRDFLQSVGLQAKTPFLCSEMLYKAKEAGFSIKEVGIPYLPRHAGKATGGDPKLIYRTMAEIFVFWFRWFVLKRPMLPKGFDLPTGGVRHTTSKAERPLTRVS